MVPLNEFPTTLEERFRQILSCPDLILRTQSEWGAKQPSFREKLRHGIWQELASGLQRQDPRLKRQGGESTNPSIRSRSKIRKDFPRLREECPKTWVLSLPTKSIYCVSISESRRGQESDRHAKEELGDFLPKINAPRELAELLSGK